MAASGCSIGKKVLFLLSVPLDPQRLVETQKTQERQKIEKMEHRAKGSPRVPVLLALCLPFARRRIRCLKLVIAGAHVRLEKTADRF